MKISLRKGLGYITATLMYHAKEIILDNVLLDTGSAGSIFSADKVSEIGLHIEPYDPIRRIRGIGGTEFVFMKKVDKLCLGELRTDNFEIEVGTMDYGGIELDGIIGLDFLLQVGAIIDLKNSEIR